MKIPCNSFPFILLGFNQVMRQDMDTGFSLFFICDIMGINGQFFNLGIFTKYRKYPDFKYLFSNCLFITGWGA